LLFAGAGAADSAPATTSISSVFMISKKCAATRGGYASAPITWVLENGLHRHTRLKNGKLMRRSPYPAIGFGLLEGLREWYGVLMGGRKASWDVSYDK
jgi:hypothetical protein